MGDLLRAVSKLAYFDTGGGGYASAQSWSNAYRSESFANLMKTWKAIPATLGLVE